MTINIAQFYVSKCLININYLPRAKELGSNRQANQKNHQKNEWFDWLVYSIEKLIHVP